MAKNPGVRPKRLGTRFVADDPFWIRLVSDDRLLDIAQQFIGPNIALFASHYISKPAFDGQPVLWHQDAEYWPLEPMDVVTLWLSVDDSLPENGCMRVNPKTQTMPIQEHKRNTVVDNVLNSEMESRAEDGHRYYVYLRWNSQTTGFIRLHICSIPLISPDLYYTYYRYPSISANLILVFILGPRLTTAEWHMMTGHIFWFRHVYGMKLTL